MAVNQQSSKSGVVDRSISIAVDSLTYTAVHRKSKTKFNVLNKVSLVAQPGQLLAIMGPSGCGKSTLLNLMAGRIEKDSMVQGNIYFNGNSNSNPSDFSRYVMQQDHLIEYLTVEETLMTAARLKLKSVSLEDRQARVDAVMKELGLWDCRHTLVGGHSEKGISGGERKRVSIALELIEDPRLIFLDEPTTGLDSSRAYDTLQILINLARAGRTIVCTVHSPRSPVFALFDQLCLLSKGQIVYHGPASAAVPYFSSIGFPCPSWCSPPDFLLDLLTTTNHDDESNPSTSDLATSASHSSAGLSAPSNNSLQASPEQHPCIRINNDSRGNHHNNKELHSPSRMEAGVSGYRSAIRLDENRQVDDVPLIRGAVPPPTEDTAIISRSLSLEDRQHRNNIPAHPGVVQQLKEFRMNNSSGANAVRAHLRRTQLEDMALQEGLSNKGKKETRISIPIEVIRTLPSLWSSSPHAVDVALRVEAYSVEYLSNAGFISKSTNQQGDYYQGSTDSDAGRNSRLGSRNQASSMDGRDITSLSVTSSQYEHKPANKGGIKKFSFFSFMKPSKANKTQGLEDLRRKHLSQFEEQSIAYISVMRIGWWLLELFVLTRRLMIMTFRLPKQLALAFAQKALASVVLGWFFYMLGSADDKAASNRTGLLFWLCLNTTIALHNVLAFFPMRRALVNKEMANGMYSPSAYYFAECISALPLEIVGNTMFFTVVFFMAGLNNFGPYLLISNLLVFAIIGIMTLCSTMSPSVEIANIVASLIILFFVLTSGFYVHSDNIPTPLYWISYLSYMRYAFAGYLLNDFTDARFDKNISVLTARGLDENGNPIDSNTNAVANSVESSTRTTSNSEYSDMESASASAPSRTLSSATLRGAAAIADTPLSPTLNTGSDFIEIIDEIAPSSSFSRKLSATPTSFATTSLQTTPELFMPAMDSVVLSGLRASTTDILQSFDFCYQAGVHLEDTNRLNACMDQATGLTLTSYGGSAIKRGTLGIALVRECLSNGEAQLAAMFAGGIADRALSWQVLGLSLDGCLDNLHESVMNRSTVMLYPPWSEAEIHQAVASNCPSLYNPDSSDMLTTQSFAACANKVRHTGLQMYHESVTRASDNEIEAAFLQCRLQVFAPFKGALPASAEPTCLLKVGREYNPEKSDIYIAPDEHAVYQAIRHSCADDSMKVTHECAVTTRASAIKVDSDCLLETGQTCAAGSMSMSDYVAKVISDQSKDTSFSGQQLIDQLGFSEVGFGECCWMLLLLGFAYRVLGFFVFRFAHRKVGLEL